MPTKTNFNSGGVILVEDANGTRYRLIVAAKNGENASNWTGARKTVKTVTTLSYKVEDGRAVAKIDDNTFKIARTGETLRVVEE